MNHLTVTSSSETMEESKDGDGIQWFEYEWIHLEAHSFCGFSNLSRYMAAIFLRVECKPIRFEVHHGDEVAVDWLQYFYSARLPPIKIDIIVVRTFFTTIDLLLKDFFNECTFDSVLSFLSSLDIFGWDLGANSKRSWRNVLILMQLLLNIAVKELFSFS